MLKLMGTVLLIAAGSGVGMIRAERLKGREQTLAAAVRLIAWLKARLRYTSAPLAELLALAAREGGFAPLTIPSPCASAPFPVWWKMLTAGADLSPEDRAVLLRFGEEMGRTDLAGQLAHMEMYGELLEERRRLAAEEYRKKHRIPVTVWTAGAAAAALLFW